MSRLFLDSEMDCCFIWTRPTMWNIGLDITWDKKPKQKSALCRHWLYLHKAQEVTFIHHMNLALAHELCTDLKTCACAVIGKQSITGWCDVAVRELEVVLPNQSWFVYNNCTSLSEIVLLWEKTYGHLCNIYRYLLKPQTCLHFYVFWVLGLYLDVDYSNNNAP